MAALEACQANPALTDLLDELVQNLAKAQGKLFPAIKLPPDSPASVDMMRRAMDYLAQSLSILQETRDIGEAAEITAASIARALKALHPVVKAAKDEAATRSIPPASPTDSGALSVNVNTMLNMSTDHQFYNGFSQNIEEGGIFVATFDPKPIDSRVIVNFKLPGGRPVTARGLVHWVREYNPMTPDMAPGMGVKFTDLLPEDKKAIEEYVSKRAPMFYDDDK